MTVEHLCSADRFDAPKDLVTGPNNIKLTKGTSSIKVLNIVQIMRKILRIFRHRVMIPINFKLRQTIWVFPITMGYKIFRYFSFNLIITHFHRSWLKAKNILF